jgi:hypothetical protein
MIEIREDDFYEFSIKLDGILYKQGIQSQISPLWGWDMICDTVNEKGCE